ncbi:hypothetical protein DH2020_013856 [Rehmannia glutinosa]|uniref:E3 SUMO-protein ligase SIZ1 n=1 Tax=Rehmannia glutinosa TaxID=99300 RepID=A0ABR0W3X1_REHGL
MVMHSRSSPLSSHYLFVPTPKTNYYLYMHLPSMPDGHLLAIHRLLALGPLKVRQREQQVTTPISISIFPVCVQMHVREDVDMSDKLAYFRIKELKDVLTQLGLSKQGKKQDLVDRILAILSDERGMWAKKNAVGKEGVAKLVDDTYRKMQVSGASDLASNHKPFQICEDPRCNVWQHIACVLIPEKPMEGVLPNPPDLELADSLGYSSLSVDLSHSFVQYSFWVTVAHPLHPVKLNITNVPADGSSPSQSIEKTFQLTRADRDLLSKQEYDVQAWCMLLNDKVTFRMQWPQYADLQINGVPVRAINRPGSQLLGANGRDDGPVITPCTRDGINKIFLGGCDARIFCVGVRIVKRRTLQQVLNMIPKEAEGEPFEDALARVRRCVGGGAATENADSDSDIEVVADCIPVNLRCPMSGLRMKVAGRFKLCVHMGCFDLEVFVEMNQRSRKAKSKPKPELKPVKQEVGSDSHAGLRLGMKKTKMVAGKLTSQIICREFHLQIDSRKFENNEQNIIPMSSSATGSGRDCEDASVNQDGLDFSTVNAGDAEVIVLSDSEEEIEPPSSSGAVYKNTDQILSRRSRFQLFGSDVDVSDALVEMQHETAMGSAALVPDESTAQHPNTNDGLVDNPLAFSGNDPSLQIFLPTRPSDASAPQLGDGVGVRQGESGAANRLNSGQQLQSNDGALDTLTGNASLLLGMSDNNRSGKTSRERSDSPFTFPRQRRSVRPRLYLSIDTDSE